MFLASVLFQNLALISTFAPKRSRCCQTTAPNNNQVPDKMTKRRAPPDWDVGEPQPIALGLLERFKGHYDDPKFADVKVFTTNFRRDERQVLAHKIVLAASSEVFDAYFKEHPDADEVDAYELCRCSRLDAYAIETVLGHIYSFALDSNGFETYEWAGICKAAESLGVPILCEYAEQQLDKQLNEEMGPDYRVENFVEAVQDASEFAGFKVQEPDIEATRCDKVAKVVAKACCKYYRYLRDDQDFAQLRSHFPGLQKAMLDCLADQADGDLSTQSAESH
ncbi:hypothetical protein Q7P37_002094 [Cladosporium fusiforme]